MSDLIQRLRDAAVYGPVPCPICDEAADRLAEAERLLRRARAEIEATLVSESYYFGGDETIDADIDAFMTPDSATPRENADG